MNDRKLTRSRTDKWIAGVCGGLAKYLNADPLLVRLIFIVAAFVNGIGFVAYVIMMILVPKEETGFVHVSDEYSSHESIGGDLHGGGAAVGTAGGTVAAGAEAGRRRIAGFALIGLGMLFALRIGFPNIPIEYAAGAALIALGAYIITRK
ncbi:MAG: PspC domain-containing protein [bacterium]|jgi:phage shock protein PspC (stress-responsive transcriptional regulator)